MRISDWSSDVCSSDLTYDPNLKTQAFPNGAADIDPYRSYRSMFDGSVRPENNTELIYFANRVDVDDRFAFPAGGLGGNSTYRKGVGSGKVVSVRVDLGGRRIITKKNHNYI